MADAKKQTSAVDVKRLLVANKVLREQLDHARREAARWRTIANVCADRVRELTEDDAT